MECLIKTMFVLLFVFLVTVFGTSSEPLKDIVIQQRIDTLVSFDKTWKEYQDGFGNPSGSYWAGLDRIHSLTKNNPMAIRFEMKKFNDDTLYWSEYDYFRIDGPGTNYKLHIGMYNTLSTAGDSMLHEFPPLSLNGMQFSTKDKDNDGCVKCACSESGNGWWWNHCGLNNPNGKYSSNARNNRILWGDFLSLRLFRIILKPYPIPRHLPQNQLKFQSCDASSVFKDEEEADADFSCKKAMDGVSGNCLDDGISQTANSLGWWKGVFDNKYRVTDVHIYNKASSFNNNANRLNNFEIVGDDGKVCAQYKEEKTFLHKKFSCNTITNSIIIRLKEENVLELCEVIPYGKLEIPIQQRIDNTLSFDKNWKEYQKGFGEPNGNYWAGLDYIHHLTKKRPFIIRFEMKKVNDETVYWSEYDYFRIDGPGFNYKLHIGMYNNQSTAGDSILDSFQYLNLNGMEFSTKDRDNDFSKETSCSLPFNGGWWYNWCTKTNPNYAVATGVTWFSLNGYWEGKNRIAPTLKWFRILLKDY